MKEYFSHDYSARDDEKIKRLLYAHSWGGYGLYWAIIEMLYQNEGTMLTEYDRFAFDLRADAGVIESIINDFGLFKIKKDSFYSQSVIDRLELRKSKSESARRSASIRWGNANAQRTHSGSNAIKVKESKEKVKKKNIKEREGEFKKELESYGGKYSVGMLRDFFNHWSEVNTAGTKMKKEMEESWETPKRLAKWHSNSLNWKK